MPIENSVIRACLLYEFKLGSKAAVACRKIRTAFGEDVISERTAQKWFKKFASGDEGIDDAPRSGRPTVIDDEELRVLVESNPRVSCQELARVFKVSVETVRLHLHRLGKTSTLGKWVPFDYVVGQEESSMT